jgi:hypothetical protein
VTDTNVFRGYDTLSDHYLVVSKIHLYTRWKSQTKKKTQISEIFKVCLLEHESICNLYQERINQHLQAKSISENIEEEWENLKEILTKAAREEIGQKKKYRRRKGLKIRTEEIEQAVKKKPEHYGKYLSNPLEVTKEEYNKVRNETKNLIRRAHGKHGRQNIAFKVMKTLNSPERDTIQIKGIENEYWEKHYKDLKFDETKEDKEEMDNLKEQINVDIDDIDGITLEEVKKAIKSMKNRKAAGLNGINVTLVKYSGSLFHLRLLHFLNMCWKLLRTPKEWSKAKIISIYKKGDRTDTNNYRGISLLDTIYKIYAKIFNEKLKQ